MSIMQVSHFEVIKFNILPVNYYRLGGGLKKGWRRRRKNILIRNPPKNPN